MEKFVYFLKDKSPNGKNKIKRLNDEIVNKIYKKTTGEFFLIIKMRVPCIGTCVGVEVATRMSTI